MVMMFCNGIAGVIAESSVEIAVVGRHYDRAMRLWKESFNACVYFRVKLIVNNFVSINQELLLNTINSWIV